MTRVVVIKVVFTLYIACFRPSSCIVFSHSAFLLPERY